MQQELTFEIDQPHLWNGRQDPFLYQAEVTLFRNGQMVDRVTQPLGLRFYRIDPDKGFFLNGKHLPLQGVCRHQDRSEVGNALRPQHHEVRNRLNFGHYLVSIIIPEIIFTTVTTLVVYRFFLFINRKLKEWEQRRDSNIV